MKNLISKFAIFVFSLMILGILSLVTKVIVKKGVYFQNDKGESLFWKGKDKEAEKLWKSEWEKSKNLKIARNLSILYLKEGWRKEGIEFHKEALSFYPDDPKLRFNLALLYFQENELDNSLKELEKINLKYPFFQNLHYLKGLILEKEGEKEKAYKEFIKEVNNYPGCVGAWSKIKGFPSRIEKLD